MPGRRTPLDQRDRRVQLQAQPHEQLQSLQLRSSHLLHMHVIMTAWYMHSCASQHLKHYLHIHPSDRILLDCQRSDYRIRGATDETLPPKWGSCRCDGPDSAMVHVCIGGLPLCRRSPR